MFIDDEGALRDWLVTTLEPLCDAEPIALARYVLALVAKDKPLDKLRENCIDRLDVFLDRSTKDFVDQLFDVIRNRRYIPEGKKENVQPSEVPNELSPRNPEDQPSSSTTTSHQPITRRHSSKRHAGSSPSTKRPQRSYSHSSNDSPPPTSSSSSPPPLPASTQDTNFSSTKLPCKDFFDNKGYCALGDTCPYDHGSNILSFEPPNYYPSYQPYNPDQPSIRQPLPTGQRTLVTVVTNAEPLPLEPRQRSNHSGGPVPRTRRHVTTTPYPNDRRTQDRTRKRPWSKPDGSGSTTLEIRKIPVESNTISNLNEHFSKFGTVTNVQIAFDGSPDCALVAYSTFQQAETAYKNPEPLFNNRFIKIFWHNPEKSSQKPAATSEAPTPKKSVPPPPPVKHHWPKASKPSLKKHPPPATPPVSKGPSQIKKDAAKKAAFEIRRKKQGLLEEQIQQQKLLLKKLETAETNEEKESIRALMKQVDSTIVKLKDSLAGTTVKSISKLSQQDLLKQRAEKLQKELENLRAKTSADMRRAMSNTLEKKLPSHTTSNDAQDDDAEEDELLNETDPMKKQNYQIELHDEIQLLDS